MSRELFPICPKCHDVMRLAAIEDVPGPNERICYVSVYACKQCYRLSAYELARLDLDCTDEVRISCEVKE